MRIHVAFTPDEMDDQARSGACVVVDVLRATSSMVTAMSNGCSGIHPVVEPSQAFPLADGRSVLACGERQGVKIAGYHMGNSPLEFAGQAVEGKRLVMCTTNGTRAIRAAWGFRRMLIGSFLNGPTLAHRLREEGEGITIVCAGREGSFSLEDTLCAGMLLSDVEGEMSDGAVAAATLFEKYQDRLEEVLLESEHGRFLRGIGFEEDVQYCARVGITESVPEVSRSGEAPPYDLFIKRPSVSKNHGEVPDD